MRSDGLDYIVKIRYCSKGAHETMCDVSVLLGPNRVRVYATSQKEANDRSAPVSRSSDYRQCSTKPRIRHTCSTVVWPKELHKFTLFLLTKNRQDRGHSLLCVVSTNRRWRRRTRNSPGDEIANVNYLYDDIVHVGLLQNTVDSCIPLQIDAAVSLCVGTHVYQIQWNNAI